MSKFCIGIIPESSTIPLHPEILEEVKAFAEKLGFEFTPGCIYEEPFIAQTLNPSDSAFELTKDGVAEKILCPDWCQYNDELPSIRLKDRLFGLQTLIQFIIQYAPRIDLYIGESGCEWNDFLHHSVKVSETVAILESECENHSGITDIHLSINK